LLCVGAIAGAQYGQSDWGVHRWWY
jgi:hypothetical protein